MGQQHGTAVSILKILQIRTFKFLCLAAPEIYLRNTAAAGTADAQLLILNRNILIGIFQHPNAPVFQHSGQIASEILLVHLFMISDRGIHRRDLHQLLCQIHGDLRILLRAGDHVSGKEDQIRLLPGNQGQQISVSRSEFGVVQI